MLTGAVFGCSPSRPPRVEPAEQAQPRAAEAEPAQPKPAPEPAAPEPAMAKPSPEAPAPAADAASAKLQQLQPSKATLTAPERYTVLFETTKGEIYIDVRRSWAPLGADRFYNLVKLGFYDDVAFFRVIEGFVAQGGLNADPAVNALWRNATIPDDPVTQSNQRGMLTFATSGKDSRTTQFFINLGDNVQLDRMGFAPIGRVRDLGMLDKLYAGYGEGAPAGRGPMQARIQREGNTYLRGEFPELDYIKRALIVDEKGQPATHP